MKKILSSMDFLHLCRNEVATYFNDHIERPDEVSKITPDDVYVVWYCKTLQHRKALLSYPFEDGMYYECTYDGNTNRLYLDAYEKVNKRNIVL